MSNYELGSGRESPRLRHRFVLLARAGTALAFCVVVVGAMVRLSDAGLGCPDWPGCYGQLLVPDSEVAAQVSQAYPDRPLDVVKAWWEMGHRYIAALLGLICVGLGVLAFLNRRDPEQPTWAAYGLVALVIFQGMLGMWTVTLLLKPLIVMGHLLGGLATLSLLFWLSRGTVRPLPVDPGLARWGLFAACVLVVQIALGGWTSANYAALACPDFPTCQTQWWPENADYDEGFLLWRGIGIDYEGGVLDNPGRVAIHFTHRLGAIVASLVLAIFAYRLTRVPQGFGAGVLIAVALVAQVSLGIATVLLGVPLAVAAAHNGVAAALLLSVVNANQRIRA